MTSVVCENVTMETFPSGFSKLCSVACRLHGDATASGFRPDYCQLIILIMANISAHFILRFMSSSFLFKTLTLFCFSYVGCRLISAVSYFFRFLSPNKSPNGEAMLIAAGSVSGTVSFFRVVDTTAATAENTGKLCHHNRGS